MEFVELFLENFVPLVATALGAVVAYYVRTWIKENEKKDIIQATVQYVEQVYKELDGEQKFELALKRVEKLFKNKGLDIDKDEIETWIEAFVREFRDNFDWPVKNKSE